MISRRSLFLGAGASLLAAPSIVRAASLMPVTSNNRLRVGDPMTPLRIIPFKPGVIVRDDGPFAATGYAVPTDRIRWVTGRVTILGGWQPA